MSPSLEKFLAKEPRKDTTKALRGLYDETLDPLAAATLYFSCVPNSLNAWDAASEFYGLWWGIKEASYHSEIHEKLLEMMDSIRFLPDILSPGGKSIMKWSDYPQLHTHDCFLWRNRNASYNDNKNYINETAFIARLSARRIPNADFLDQATFSEFESYAIPKAAKGDKEALYELQSNVPHSAQWIFFAGKRIFETIYAEEEEGGDWKRFGKCSKVRNEFTRVRWDAWKRGAAEVAQLPKVDKETKEIAARMVEAMEGIEKEAKAGEES